MLTSKRVVCRVAIIRGKHRVSARAEQSQDPTEGLNSFDEAGDTKSHQNHVKPVREWIVLGQDTFGQTAPKSNTSHIDIQRPKPCTGIREHCRRIVNTLNKLNLVRPE